MKTTISDLDPGLFAHFKYLSPYLRPHKWGLVLSCVLSGMSTALGMIQPYFAKVLIDSVFLAGRYSSLAPLLALMIALLMLSFGIRVGNSVLYTRYSARILFSMRQDLFDHFHRIPLVHFTRRRIGDICTRIGSDMADIQRFLTDALPHLLFNLLTCLITGAILLWLNPKMALLSFLFLPAGLYVVHRLKPLLFHLAQEVAETNADISHFLMESLSNTPVVRAFGAEEVEGAKLRKKQGRVMGFLMRYQLIGAISGAVPVFFIIVNTLVVFGYGGLLVRSGSITIGTLVAFSIYQGRVFGPLQGLMDGFMALQKSRVAIQRVREMYDIQPNQPGGESLLPKLPRTEHGTRIEFKSVSFGYVSDQPVFSGLNIDIPAGETTALIGPSGSGKSTLCHLLMRLFDPQSGRILLNGVDLRKMNSAVLRRNVSIVSQDIYLFHTSLRENIRFARPDASDEMVLNAAKAACLHDFIETLPDGYETIIGDRGVRVSGGQKQRICIARAILADPTVLILDEATAFLDTAVESLFRKTVEELMAGRTILVVSHRLSALTGADHLIVLGEEGAIYQGPFDGYSQAE